MEIKIAAQKFELTEALKNYVTEKLNHIKHYGDSCSSVDAVLRGEKNRHIVHLLAKGTFKPLFCEAFSQGNMYQAVSAAVRKLERQLRKHKTK